MVLKTIFKTNSIADQKRKLRTELSILRKKIVTSEYKNISFDKLLNQSWFQKSKVVALYISQEFEFPTQGLFDFCIREGKMVCAPIMDSNKELTFHMIDSWENFGKNERNIMEPVFGQLIRPEKIDAFFIPLLAFDRSGNRLGRAGGSYDKLFSNHLNTGIKVGVGFEFQDYFSVPVEKHDVSMDYILTEKRIFRTL